MSDLLVVEDENSLRQVITLALEMEGYHVRAVASGTQAVQETESYVPDLVILDLSLPDMSGWDVLAHLRQNPLMAHTPILIMTALAEDSTRRRVLSERVEGLLIKPVNLEKILETVKNLLP